MFKLNNKNIIVTGATQGIGKQIAHSISELGSNIILLGRNMEKLTNLEKELSQKYQKLITVISDLTTFFPL